MHGATVNIHVHVICFIINRSFFKFSVAVAHESILSRQKLGLWSVVNGSQYFVGPPLCMLLWIGHNLSNVE
jgi:hypothetical protein